MPLESFAVDKSKRSGRKSLCRGCDNQRSKAYYVEHREERLAYHAERRPAGFREGDVIRRAGAAAAGVAGIVRGANFRQVNAALQSFLKAPVSDRRRALLVASGAGRPESLEPGPSALS